MLDQVNKNIQRYVDSGEYFKDAKDWYASKYLFPFTLRSVVILFFVIMVGATYILIDLARDDAKIKQYPFPIYAYDTINYFPLMKSIADIKEPINISVARYFAGKYIEFREEYKYMDLQGDGKIVLDKKIQALSSRRSFREYADYMDPELNPDSPYIKYKTQTQRVIKVKSVELFGRYDLPERASVVYEAIERTKGNDVTSTWQADIDFTMLDLEKKDASNKTKLNFTVTNYVTNKL